MSERRSGTIALRLAAVTVIAGHGVLAWIGRGPGVLTRQDDALYVILARSLLRGTYRDLHRLGTPLHALYPPGYPAELALWGSLFGFGHDRLVLFSVLCSVFALFLVWRVTERILDPWLALAVVAPVAVNPMLLEAAGSIASEAPYLMLTAVTLWLGFRSRERGRPRRSQLLVLGILAVLASVTRAAGVALLAAVLLDWLLDRRWVAAGAFGILSALVFAGWLTFSGHVNRDVGGKSYVAELGPEISPAPRPPGEPEPTGPGVVAAAMVRQTVSNGRFYASVGVPWTMAMPTIPGTSLDNVVGVVLLLAAGFAGVVVLARRWRIAALYLLAYGGVLLSYVWQQERFVVPLTPFIVLAVMAGAQWWAHRLRWQRLRVLLPGLASIALIGGGLARSVPAVARLSHCDRSGEVPDPECMRADQRSWFDAIRYVDGHLPSGAVLLTAKPEPLFYYTGHRTVDVGKVASPPDSTFIGRARAIGAEYILLGSLQVVEPGRLSRRMLANCDSLRLVAFFPARTYLFRIAAPGSDAERRASCDAMARYRAANLHRDFSRDP